MKAVFGLMLVLVALVGCGGKDKAATPRVATADEIQQQKDNEKQVHEAEREMQKNQPREKTAIQNAEEEERRRAQGR